MFTSFNPRAVGLDLPTRQSIRLAHDAGFEGVDILVRDLLADGLDPRSIRAELDDLGLQPGAWPLPVHWRGTEAASRADLQALPRLADAAAALGLLRTGTWVLPALPAAGNPHSDAPTDPRRLLDWHVLRLGAIVRVLAAAGIQLGLEVIGVESCRPGLDPFLSRLDSLAPLRAALAAAGTPAGLVVDAFHLYAAGEDLDALDGLLAGEITLVHVADLPAGSGLDRSTILDPNRALPGDRGAIDAAAFLRRIDRTGYPGPVIVETITCPGSLRSLPAKSAVHQVARALRACWPDPSSDPSARPDLQPGS